MAVIPAACGAGDDPAYERLVEAVTQKKAECGCPWGAMAVLTRTNGHMDKAAAVLAKAGIPTSGIRGRELLSLREGTALWLSLIALFTGHDGSFIPRGLTALGYDEALTAAVTRLTGTVGTAPRPHRFSAFASALRDLMPHFPRVLIETLWDEAERYFDRPDAGDAAAFLSYLLTMSHLITVPEGEHADRVKLATIHGTKGLEFPHVFLFWKEGLDRAPEIPHPDDGCPLSLTKDELAFLATGPIAGSGGHRRGGGSGEGREGRRDGEPPLCRRDPRREEPDDPPAGRPGGRTERLQRSDVSHGPEAIPDAERTAFGWRHDYGPEKPRPSDHEELTAPDLAEGFVAPADSDEMDPALRSADIEAGIERGIRIHAALAQLTGDRKTIVPANLAARRNWPPSSGSSVTRRCARSSSGPGASSPNSTSPTPACSASSTGSSSPPTASPSSTSRRAVSATLPTSTASR